MDLESEIPITSLKLFNGNLHIIKKSNQDEFAVTEIVALAPKPITRPNFQKSKKIIYCIILEVENIRKIKFDDKRIPGDSFNIFHSNFKKILVYGTIVYENVRTKNGKQLCSYKIDDGTGVLSVLFFPNKRKDLPACNRNYLIRDIIKQPKRLLNPKANPKESRAGYYLTSITEHNILQQNNLELFKKVLVIGTPFINRDNEVCLNISSFPA